MYREAGKGIRCRICTGCGLCPGVIPDKLQAEVISSETGAEPYEQGGAPRKDRAAGADKLHVLAEDALLGRRLPLKGGGRRLVAADIGTTTIAMLLYHEDGSVADRYVAVNPQTMYGADVLSRIRAAEDPECAGEMRRQVEGVLEKGVRRFAVGLSAGESLYMVLAANTTMTYLLMGWDVRELGQAPFAASCLWAVAGETAGIPCFVFPGLSAFVGGDIAAGIHACRMAEGEEIVLLVDLGTNGEMVLGNRSRRISCATAAGPAFEGGVNAGIWGADMVSLLARLLEEGVLDTTGLLSPEYFDAGIRIGNVTVTQRAVRSIQLAKAAIAAGIEILLEKYDIRAEQVDKVVLAGGFGYYLKPDAAARIGLLPAGLAGKAVTGGNTVLSGALRAGRQLFSLGEESLTKTLEEINAGTEVINLAMEAGFEERYIGNMDF